MAALDILEHPLGFRMIFYRFPAYGFQVVDFFNFPMFGFGMVMGAACVVLGAFAFGLIFVSNAAPNSNDFCRWFVHIPYSDSGISRVVSSFSAQVNDCHKAAFKAKI